MKPSKKAIALIRKNIRLKCDELVKAIDKVVKDLKEKDGRKDN